MKYVYRCYVDENNIVSFPDFDVQTEGKNLYDALEMAQDCLAMLLVDLEDNRQSIPEPTKGDCTSLVTVDTLAYRKKYANTTVKKNLTIPRWLNTMAENKGLNFSQILTEALKEKLEFF